MPCLYCLKLKPPKRFYVGQTPVGRFETRLDEHKYYGGAKWTTRHGVDNVLWKKYVSEAEVKYLEDLECAKIMAQHGINSCRGGLFNIAKDVERIPVWARPVYVERAAQIMAASH